MSPVKTYFKWRYKRKVPALVDRRQACLLHLESIERLNVIGTELQKLAIKLLESTRVGLLQATRKNAQGKYHGDLKHIAKALNITEAVFGHGNERVGKKLHRFDARLRDCNDARAVRSVEHLFNDALKKMHNAAVTLGRADMRWSHTHMFDASALIDQANRTMDECKKRRELDEQTAALRLSK